MVILQKASPPPWAAGGFRLGRAPPPRGPLVLQVLVILPKDCPPPRCGPAGGFRLGPRLRVVPRSANPPPQVRGDTIGGGVAARRPEPYRKIFEIWPTWECKGRTPCESPTLSVMPLHASACQGRAWCQFASWASSLATEAKLALMFWGLEVDDTTMAYWLIGRSLHGYSLAIDILLVSLLIQTRRMAQWGPPLALLFFSHFLFPNS